MADLDSELGPELSDVQFLGHCISDWETLHAICFSKKEGTDT